MKNFQLFKRKKKKKHRFHSWKSREDMKNPNLLLISAFYLGMQNFKQIMPNLGGAIDFWNNPLLGGFPSYEIYFTWDEISAMQ